MWTKQRREKAVKKKRRSLGGGRKRAEIWKKLKETNKPEKE